MVAVIQLSERWRNKRLSVIMLVWNTYTIYTSFIISLANAQPMNLAYWQCLKRQPVLLYVVWDTLFVHYYIHLSVATYIYTTDGLYWYIPVEAAEADLGKYVLCNKLIVYTQLFLQRPPARAHMYVQTTLCTV